MKFIVIAIIILVVLYFIAKSKRNAKPKDKPKEKKAVSISIASDNQKTNENDEIDQLKKKYPKWYSSNKTKGKCYKPKSPLEVIDTESTVNYKTDEYAELFGRGAHCSYFPGYGKIYNRTFEIWYQETGSKDKLDLQEYFDIGVERNQPFHVEDITNGIIISNELERTKGYIKLWNARDQKNNITWYAGLKNLEYTNIITKREREEKTTHNSA